MTMTAGTNGSHRERRDGCARGSGAAVTLLIPLGYGHVR